MHLSLALLAFALGAHARLQTDPCPVDPKSTGGPAVVRFRYDSAWDCTAIGTCGVAYLRDVTRAGVCNTFPWGTRSITIDSLDPQCKLTIYNQPGCRGDGLDIGVGGCYSNDPLYGYKVTCPWKPGYE